MRRHALLTAVGLVLMAALTVTPVPAAEDSEGMLVLTGANTRRAGQRSERVLDAAAAGRLTVAAPELYPKGIAHDAATGRLFLGSLTQRRIVQVRPDGTVEPFADGGPDGLLQVIHQCQVRPSVL